MSALARPPRVPALAPAALGILLAASPAWAVHCDHTDNDRMEASRVIGKVRSAAAGTNARIDSMDRDVIDTLTRATAQLSLYVKQLGTLHTRLTDGAQKQAARRARQRQRAAITRALLPQRSFCQAVTGLAGLAPAEARARDVARKTAGAGLDRLAQTAPGPAGKAVSARARIDALRPWQTCSNRDRDAFLTGRAACVENADIDPLSLLGAATLDGAGARRASLDFIDNVIAPVADDPMPITAISSERDRLEFLARRARLSRKALALTVLLAIRADRAPAVRMGAYANALAPKDLARGETLSKTDLYRLIAADYFRRPGYFVSLQGLTPENRQLESLRNQAVGLMLAEEAYEQRQRTNMLLAAVLAQGVESARRAQPLPTSTAPRNP